ncbi:hypothetical protein [Armatimonas rosea]|uniref:Lipoprotein n=1 Tax=Armatimonas rosea TaxID=685828 RepID=A0A7W9SME0_ARMRO|nr:hypothetical protein [Armatimonas rosea]MBB6048849.1 hypothetical protein [Armatimonas rosea]
MRKELFWGLALLMLGGCQEKDPLAEAAPPPKPSAVAAPPPAGKKESALPASLQNNPGTQVPVSAPR